METDIARKKSRIEELEERLMIVEKDYEGYKVMVQKLIHCINLTKFTFI